MLLAPSTHPSLPHRSLSASQLSLAPALRFHSQPPRSLMPRTASLAPPPLTRLRTRSYTADGPRSPDLVVPPPPSPCPSESDEDPSSPASSSPVTPVQLPLLLPALPQLAPDALPLWAHFVPAPKPPRPRVPSVPSDALPAPPAAQLVGRLALLTALLAVSLLAVALALSSLPALRLPTSLAAVRVQIAGLRQYAHSSCPAALHTAAVLGAVFVFKQAFSVPGAVLMNVLMGAVYGTPLATAMTCLLTAVGSCGAYAMARVARPVVCRLLPGPLAAVEEAVRRFRVPAASPKAPPSLDHAGAPAFDSAEIASYLLVARLVPVVPYAGLNLASGVLGIPLRPFFWTLVVGSLPYNFVTTQVGEILQMATEGLAAPTGGVVPIRLSSLWTYTLVGKLVGVSIVGLVPVLCKGKIKGWVARAKRLWVWWWRWGVHKRGCGSGGEGEGEGWVVAMENRYQVVSENEGSSGVESPSCSCSSQSSKLAV